jgi:hypothetical protein
MATKENKNTNSKKGLVTPDQKEREKVVDERTESSKEMSSDQSLEKDKKKKK